MTEACNQLDEVGDVTSAASAIQPTNRPPWHPLVSRSRHQGAGWLVCWLSTVAGSSVARGAAGWPRERKVCYDRQFQDRHRAAVHEYGYRSHECLGSQARRLLVHEPTRQGESRVRSGLQREDAAEYACRATLVAGQGPAVQSLDGRCL